MKETSIVWIEKRTQDSVFWSIQRKKRKESEQNIGRQKNKRMIMSRIFYRCVGVIFGSFTRMSRSMALSLNKDHIKMIKKTKKDHIKIKVD